MEENTLSLFVKSTQYNLKEGDIVELSYRKTQKDGSKKVENVCGKLVKLAKAGTSDSLVLVDYNVSVDNTIHNVAQEDIVDIFSVQRGENYDYSPVLCTDDKVLLLRAKDGQTVEFTTDGINWQPVGAIIGDNANITVNETLLPAIKKAGYVADTETLGKAIYDVLSEHGDVKSSIGEIKTSLAEVQTKVDGISTDGFATEESLNTVKESVATLSTKVDSKVGEDDVNSAIDAKLVDYAKSADVTAAIKEVSDKIPTSVTGDFVTTEAMNTALGDKVDNTAFDTYKGTVADALAGKVDIATLSDYATTTALNNEVAALNTKISALSPTDGSGIDFADLATKDELATKVSTEDFEKYKTENSIALAGKVDSATLNDYATTENVSKALANKANTSDIPDLSGYATTESVSATLADYAKNTDIPDVEGLATTEAMNTALAGKVDTTTLNDYATTENVSKALANKANTSDIPDLSGYATTESLTTTLANYAKNTDIPDIEGLATTEAMNTALADKADASALSTVSTKADSTETALTELLTKLDDDTINAIKELVAKKTELLALLTSNETV